MSDSDLRERAGRSQPAAGPFDLLTSKLRRPEVRPGTVRRLALIERLARGDVPSDRLGGRAGRATGRRRCCRSGPSATARRSRGCRSMKQDNDPKVLLTYVAEALDAVEPVGERVFDALASPGSSVPGSVVPRLGAAFSSMTSPVVLVLDDVHVLHNSECRAALSVLADHVPGGSRLVLAGPGRAAAADRAAARRGQDPGDRPG